MAIYYTIYEGGKIKPMPVKCQHSKIVKQLYRHRNRHPRLGDYFTHVKITGIKLPLRVHSVFFTKSKVITKIWDSNLNGYRPLKKIMVAPINI